MTETTQKTNDEVQRPTNENLREDGDALEMDADEFTNMLRTANRRGYKEAKSDIFDFVAYMDAEELKQIDPSLESEGFAGDVRAAKGFLLAHYAWFRPWSNLVEPKQRKEVESTNNE